MHKRITKDIADADRYAKRSTLLVLLLIYASPPRKLLDDLNRVGFKTNMGVDGSGFLILAMLRLGGYYLGMRLHP